MLAASYKTPLARISHFILPIRFLSYHSGSKTRPTCCKRLRNLQLTPSIAVGRAVNDQPDLDLLYFEPYIPRGTERVLFEFLRSQLPFYRVEYDINRGGVSTHIRSTLFTLSRFSPGLCSSSPLNPGC